MAETARKPLIPPILGEKILLHSCCAPCSGEIMEAIAFSGIPLTVLFYNPNIYPESEYQLRKQEAARFAVKMSIPFVDLDYDPDAWTKKTHGLEQEQERGKRCDICFSMRLERTAQYAVENNFRIFATSLGISRWKDIQQVYKCGATAASRYPGLIFWDYNWRKQGGAERKEQITKRENFYRQNYCGCSFSMKMTLPPQGIPSNLS
ncbi:MAG TPA: epoxyqueuosine reductase QueH [Candidatus Omnitrophota bacterium]|nr:epoxyqueuosine reductase QueH [Candidatus Omnitrophota bacterium]HPN56290.1 epoxyqueuosine reductase QueH [Candidatus Omnitrophota bacterium]